MEVMESATRAAAIDCGIEAAQAIENLEKQKPRWYSEATSCGGVAGEDVLNAQSMLARAMSPTIDAPSKAREKGNYSLEISGIPPIYRDLMNIDDENGVDCAMLERHYLFFAAIRTHGQQEADSCLSNVGKPKVPDHKAKKGKIDDENAG